MCEWGFSRQIIYWPFTPLTGGGGLGALIHAPLPWLVEEYHLLLAWGSGMVGPCSAALLWHSLVARSLSTNSVLTGPGLCSRVCCWNPPPHLTHQDRITWQVWGKHEFVLFTSFFRIKYGFQFWKNEMPLHGLKSVITFTTINVRWKLWIHFKTIEAHTKPPPQFWGLLDSWLGWDDSVFAWDDSMFASVSQFGSFVPSVFSHTHSLGPAIPVAPCLRWS